MYVFFGLIASGKSTLAEAFAEKCGFTYYNTDRVRKELAGRMSEKSDKDGYGQGIYTEEFTLKTYKSMLKSAERDLRTFSSVVLDGSYTDKKQRNLVREMAVQLNCPVIFIYCHCSEAETKRRLELRARDPQAVSDGRWEIFVHQREKFILPRELAPQEFMVIDTDDTVENLLNQLTATLAEMKESDKRALH